MTTSFTSKTINHFHRVEWVVQRATAHFVFQTLVQFENCNFRRKFRIEERQSDYHLLLLLVLWRRSEFTPKLASNVSFVQLHLNEKDKWECDEPLRLCAGAEGWSWCLYNVLLLLQTSTIFGLPFLFIPIAFVRRNIIKFNILYSDGDRCTLDACRTTHWQREHTQHRNSTLISFSIFLI